MRCDERNCSNSSSSSSQASVVELYLLNVGVCHPNELLVAGDFQRRFQYFYYSLFSGCLLVMSLLYALIYRSVLVRRSRRHKQKTASLAAINSTLRPATVFDLQPDNGDELAMTTLKVRSDTQASRLYRHYVPMATLRLSVRPSVKYLPYSFVKPTVSGVQSSDTE